MPKKSGAIRRKVVSHFVVESPRGALFVRRNLECGHVTDKPFSPADRHSFQHHGVPFRVPEYAFCKWCLILLR